MPSALGFIGGGLLSGIGKGLVLTGKQKYERAMKRFEQERAQKDALELEGVKQKNRQGLLSVTNTAAMERLGLSIGSQEKLAGEATASRERISGATIAGADKRSAASIASQGTIAKAANASREGIAGAANISREGIAAAGNTSREKIANITAIATDSSAAEKRAFDSLVKIHTVADENLIETTDWNAVADGLDQKGFGKLAGSARSRGKGIVDLDIRKRAEQFADEMVEEQSSMLSTDASDFKDDGGSRVKFRARMVREYIAKNSGAAAEAPATRPAEVSVEPYVGAAQPPDFPDAKRANDGFWYVKRGDKTLRVQQPKAKRRNVR